MKTLIRYNDSLFYSSRPLYFNECLSRVGVQSSLWNVQEKISVYDKIDKEKPNLMICDYTSINEDIIRYFSSNKEIGFIIDITGCDEKALDMLEDVVIQNSISCPFFIREEYGFLSTVKQKKKKIINILPCLDIFAYKSATPEYNIEAAIISNKKSKDFDKLCSLYESYHKVYMGDVPQESFDIQANVLNMNSLYDRYKEILVVGDINFVCSQVFFDAFVKSKKLTAKVPDSQKELFNQVLATLFEQEEGEEEGEVQIESIKNQIKRKHTCFNRTAQLARELGITDLSDALIKVTEQL